MGLGTTTPSQRLEVAGQVFSSAGGFRFPDNTIQTTAAANQTLSLSGSTISLSNGGGSVTVPGDNLGNHTATQNLNLGSNQLVGNGGTSGVAISSTGHVGIGTSSPASALDVAGGEVRLPGGGGGTTHFNYSGDGKNYLRGTTVLADLGGNVGIGTASPGARLDVNGTTRTTDAIVTTALTGNGDNIGSAVGLGVRADGGLNIGQNTIGGNFCLGYQAGQVQAVNSVPMTGRGINNTFIGIRAGAVNTFSNYNVFVDYEAGSGNTTGYSNTAVGTFSGGGNTTGRDNVFLGWAAGLGSSSGDHNTFLGTESGSNSRISSDNVFIGYRAGASSSASTISNSTAIGAYAIVEQSNSLVLGGDGSATGNGDGTIRTRVNVGIGTATPSATLHVAGVSSTVRVEGLAGTDTRFVTADINGNLAAPTNTMLNRMANAQSGSTNLGSGTGTGSAPRMLTITFPTAFAAAPAQVLVTVRGQNGNAEAFMTSTHDITATSFQVNLYRADTVPFGNTYSQSPQLDWLAIP